MTRRPATDTTTAAGSGKPYQVLARRYRSKSFDEVVGQETIAKTLQNAITLGRTAHAYLFTGTRGVGKTSMARIFARALNAGDSAPSLLGGTGDAVGEAILRGQDLDVIEIDGASNRGVDDARSLIAGAGVAPTRSPYKVYIIDEVHMLTQPAFNALLKLMEEPPPHVKFILCTTEAHKVPATIQSRCQRFDFRAISTARIQAHLERVLQAEGIQWDEGALSPVSRLANGSMRDGLSLLERLIAAAGDRITAELAREVLGLPDEEQLDAIVRGVTSSDAAASLTAASEMLSTGVSVDHLLELLAERLRLALLARVCGLNGLAEDVPADACAAALAAAGDWPQEDLVHAIAMCDATSRAARSSSIPRAILDALLVRLALSDRFATMAGGMPVSSAAPRTAAQPQALPQAQPQQAAPPRRPLSPTAPPPQTAPHTTARPTINQQEAIREVTKDPLIQGLMSELDATVLRVEPLQAARASRTSTDDEDGEAAS